MNAKAPAEEIRARFDQDVERFSSLETGQLTTQDAALVLELIAASAAGRGTSASSWPGASPRSGSL